MFPASTMDVGSLSSTMLQPTRTVQSVLGQVNSVTATTVPTTSEVNAQTILMSSKTTEALSSLWPITETRMPEASSTIPVFFSEGNASSSMSSHTESLEPSGYSDFTITTGISVFSTTEFRIDTSTSVTDSIITATIQDSIGVDNTQFRSEGFVNSDDSQLLQSSSLSSSPIYPPSTNLISSTPVLHGESLTTFKPTSTLFIAPTSSESIYPSIAMVSPEPTVTLPETSSRNVTAFDQVPSPAADIPLGLVIALPVCVSIVILVCVLALIYLIRQRRQKGLRKERTKSDKELWMNTMSELPPLPPSPASLENGLTCIIPLSEVDSVNKGEKHDYIVTHEFDAKLESQLSLTMGQTLSVFEKADNGWWRGCHGDKTGWFPGDYAKKIDEEKNKPETLEITSINEDELDGSRLITNPIKPAVSSFLIRKKGQEDKSPAELVQENKRRNLVPTDQNANGVILNGNIGKDEPNCKEQNKLNEEAVVSAPVGGILMDDNTDNLPPPIDDQPLSQISATSRYTAVYPYVAAREGELTLQENDVISYLEEGSIGWVRGRKEATDEEGWVPASYLQLLNEDTMHKPTSGEALDHLKKHLFENRQLTGGREHFVGFEHYAVYPYTAQHPGDLSFEAGDSIIVLDTYETGWWHGMKGEITGWFPGSYVELKGSGGSSPSGGIYDRGGNLLSDGDHGSSASGSVTPSRDSYQGDLVKTLGEALARRQEAGDRLSIGSASTVGSDESRPKPARKAPAPPPGGARSVKRKLLRRPSRPAPPPPGPPGGTISKENNPNMDSSSHLSPTNANDSTASANTSITSESSHADGSRKHKPPPPKRSSAPKMVKIHKKKLNLENSNMLPPPPDRPVPPDPPASSKSKRSIKNFKKKSKKSKIADSKIRGSVNRLTKADISGPVSLENVYSKETEAVSLSTVSAEPIPANSQSAVSTELQNPVSQTDISETINSQVHSANTQPNVLVESPNSPKAASSILRKNSPVMKLRLEKTQSHNPPPVAPKPKHSSSRLSQKALPKRTLNGANGLSDDSLHSIDSSHSSVFTNGHIDSQIPSDSNMDDLDVPVAKPRRRNSSDDELNGALERKRSRKKSLKKVLHSHTAERDEELSYKEGSFIKLIEEVSDRPGWCRGMLADGTVGLFHGNHVEDSTINKHTIV